MRLIVPKETETETDGLLTEKPKWIVQTSKNSILDSRIRFIWIRTQLHIATFLFSLRSMIPNPIYSKNKEMKKMICARTIEIRNKTNLNLRYEQKWALFKRIMPSSPVWESLHRTQHSGLKERTQKEIESGGIAVSL